MQGLLLDLGEENRAVKSALCSDQWLHSLPTEKQYMLKQQGFAFGDESEMKLQDGYIYAGCGVAQYYLCGQEACTCLS